MKSSEEIERLIDRTRLATSESADKRIIEDARAAFAESRQTVTPSIIWKQIMKSRITKLAAAAVIMVGVLWMLHYFGGGIDMSRPAFADVVENLLSQKWVYMFEENRKSGQISAEYWYNPSERKLYAKSHTVKGSVFLLDMVAGEKYDCRDNVIYISKSDNSAGRMLWLEERIPMLGGLLSRHEREGADIVENDAVYNGKAALLYEIEITLPERNALRTVKYTWLVDRKTHLPIICEHTNLYGRDYNGTYKESVVRSQRYAFDYCDRGPRDIYDLGVPEDAKVEDVRPSPEIQELIDKINEAKEARYKSFAAVIVQSGRPKKLVIRDGRRLLENYFELKINSSDWELKKAEYIAAMGDTFESVYRWTVESGIVLRQGIDIVDEQFVYRTNDQEIEGNVRVKMSRNHGRGDHDEFTRYCWRSIPGSRIVTTPYSEEHNLICTESSNGRHHYYDPAKDYMCVRYETEEGRVQYEILEFAQTAAGMWYPCKIRKGFYYQKAGSDKLIPMSELVYIYIYACDLNDQLRAKLDPRTLPNYVDHRELTRQKKLQQEEGAQDGACIEYAGFTPLHMAIYRQDMERVKKYMEKGANLEPAYDSGATPMELAVASGNMEMVKLLYDHGADFVSNDDEHRDALGLAAKEGSYEIAQFMLANGSDANSPYKYQNRPLHYAAINVDVRMVELLLANGAKTELKDGEGRTALFVAVRYMANNRLIRIKPAEQEVFEKFKAVCTLLIEAGADINATDKSGLTALSISTCTLSCEDNNRELQLEFLKFLLECGADPDKADNSHAKGNRPLATAVSQHRLDFLKLLLESGADPWLLDSARSGRPYHHLLYFARMIKNDKLYDVLYPYMKQRYEQTNAKCLKAARQVVEACLTDSAAAIADLCIDNPDYKKPWDRWPEKIKKSYKGHEQLLDGMVAGEFTMNGFAEVYIPLPEDMKEKSVLLGFIQCPNGQWKCMSFQRTDYMPEFGQAYRGAFLHSASFSSVKNFKKHLYDQAE